MPQLSPAQATPILRAGGIIAYPTEAVWGLGCDPFDQAAVLRLLAIKQRPVDKGLILVAASLAQLDELVDWDALPQARRDEVFASRSEEHTSELQSLMRISYAVFCLKKKNLLPHLLYNNT